MTTTVPEIAGQLTREACEVLIAVASATPEDRLHWRPLDNGRSILEQLAECSVANRKWAAILRSGVYANLSEQIFEAAVSESDNLTGAVRLLREATAELLSAIETVPVD